MSVFSEWMLRVGVMLMAFCGGPLAEKMYPDQAHAIAWSTGSAFTMALLAWRRPLSRNTPETTATGVNKSGQSG